MPASLPRLGLGTWKNTDPDQCAESVRTALEAGYRHIDTAQLYNNEAAVGRGIAESSVDRDEVFLATKVMTDNLAYDDVLDSTENSLDALGVDSVDLLYVHWPMHTYDPEETLQAFDLLYDDGTIDHVGVSNFEPSQLDEAMDHLDAPIFANQVEMHPLLPQTALLERAQQDDHWLVAYSPLGRGEALIHPTVQEVAREGDYSPAQVCLAWLLTKDNVAAIPKATGERHIQENLATVEADIPQSAFDRLDAITDRERFLDPDPAPWNQ